ncbi:hypothetical protein B0A50_03219 [Salinomyces thailandicus]|uniref:INO80 complex subunit F domain-containing protein n=1 Tax=Salinomyces thailandicus TaxID=706561 RepID=A0A4U0U6N4_9PEZI|nr:hypothetical protein B0A50_03219 [Salinomyces thailandica]
MPPPSDTASQGTPLAPSVEKAYYRKCIQLKRRLNDVEGANEDLKVRRVRLDRSIMKMRLERAFLLDELRKRMDQNVDGSEASEDERMVSPPPDRPHRDKRRRHGVAPSEQPPPTHQSPYGPASGAPPFQRTPSDHSRAPQIPAGSGGHSTQTNAGPQDGHYSYAPSNEQAPPQSTPHYPPLGHGSPYGAPVGVPGAPHTNGDEHPQRPDADSSGAGGFTAVNQAPS